MSEQITLHSPPKSCRHPFHARDWEIKNGKRVEFCERCKKWLKNKRA